MKYRQDVPGRRLQHLVSIPFVYVMIIPFIILDIFLEIYHQVCFRLYGLERVRRGQYIKIDRHKLSYLKWYEKINCAYCGYGNGLMRYASEIAGRTETHWCGIKHKKDSGFKEPAHHKNFIPYGDKKKLDSLTK